MLKHYNDYGLKGANFIYLLKGCSVISVSTHLFSVTDLVLADVETSHNQAWETCALSVLYCNVAMLGRAVEVWPEHRCRL